jgi:hypothetical protein
MASPACSSSSSSSDGEPVLLPAPANVIQSINIRSHVPVMRAFLSAHSVSFRLSCPYTSQQNGKAKQILQTINDCVRTLLIHSATPLAFWAEALSTATFLINRRPCSSTGDITPFRLLFGSPPDYSHLRVFGSMCYPNTMATMTHKLCPVPRLASSSGTLPTITTIVVTTSRPGASSPLGT